MQTQSFFKFLLMLLCTTIFLSCKKSKVDQIEIFRGPEVTMGNGIANSFFTINADGIPQEVGFEMSQQAFTGLTQDPMDFPKLSFALPLDQKAKDLTPFEHIVIHWGPQGHPPANVFTLPHFDFNFYLMTTAERMAIAPYTPATAAKFDLLPPAGFMPTGFNPNPGGVPQMGKHWGDHHFQPPFTHTMVYGSYNGKFAFAGPMVTKAFLESGSKITVPYNQPQQFEKAGLYYPTKYNIYMDASTHKHYVTLSDFVKR